MASRSDTSVLPYLRLSAETAVGNYGQNPSQLTRLRG